MELSSNSKNNAFLSELIFYSSIDLLTFTFSYIYSGLSDAKTHFFLPSVPCNRLAFKKQC